MRLYRGDMSSVNDLGPEDVGQIQTPERVPELYLSLAEHLLLVGLKAGQVGAVEAGQMLGVEAGVLAGLHGPAHAVMREAVHALARRLAHLLHRVIVSSFSGRGRFVVPGQSLSSYLEYMFTWRLN